MIRQRSSREHRSTLLHYVSANGIEDFRQRTPPNIVDIARLLLDAGADVNAESDAYGGHSMTLGLVATSVHPEAAGVQIELMELLLDRGAMIERVPGEAVRACLANGRPLAARFLAERGAYLDFANAAGVGDLDRVKELLETTSNEERAKGFVWACGYGHNDVVAFLLDYGVDPGVGAGVDMTGLHLAAHEGHLDTVKLLLAHGAPIEVKNVYGGTVLGQTLWSVIHHPMPEHREIVETLLAAGAQVGEDWFTGNRSIDELLLRARPQAADADPIHDLVLRGRRVRFDAPEEARALFAEAASDRARAARAASSSRRSKASRRSIATSDAAPRRFRSTKKRCPSAATIGDPLLLAHTLRHLGDLHHDDGRDDLAEPLYDEALALYRASNAPPLDLANAIRSLAVINRHRGLVGRSVPPLRRHERPARHRRNRPAPRETAQIAIAPANGCASRAPPPRPRETTNCNAACGRRGRRLGVSRFAVAGYFFTCIASSAARSVVASFFASSTAQKCMKKRRGVSSSMWLCSAVTAIPPCAQRADHGIHFRSRAGRSRR